MLVARGERASSGFLIGEDAAYPEKEVILLDFWSRGHTLPRPCSFSRKRQIGRPSRDARFRRIIVSELGVARGLGAKREAF